MLDADALMSDARDLDGDAFMDAIDPVVPAAYRLAYGMLRSRDEAADVVQEAALNAWRHRGSFRPGAEVRPWFLAIVANECRRAVRQRWWSVIKRPDLPLVSPHPGGAEPDEGENLRRALRQLSHSDRLILVLRYYLDLPFIDVAATLRISPEAARVRSHRALARLRPIIGVFEDPSDE
jgi:RNA polymerase sigma-70 factor (ECF subfamily)